MSYAEASAAVTRHQNPVQGYGMCCVRGCMLPGSIADTTTGVSDWYCHLHHGTAYAEQAGITARMHNRRSLFILAGRLKAALPGQPVPDSVIPWLRRHNRNDFADAASGNVTAQALGALMLRVLGDECASTQPRGDTAAASAGAGLGSWFRAVDLVSDLA